MRQRCWLRSIGVSTHIKYFLSYCFLSYRESRNFQISWKQNRLRVQKHVAWCIDRRNQAVDAGWKRFQEWNKKLSRCWDSVTCCGITVYYDLGLLWRADSRRVLSLCRFPRFIALSTWSQFTNVTDTRTLCSWHKRNMRCNEQKFKGSPKKLNYVTRHAFAETTHVVELMSLHAWLCGEMRCVNMFTVTLCSGIFNDRKQLSFNCL